MSQDVTLKDVVEAIEYAFKAKFYEQFRSDLPGDSSMRSSTTRYGFVNGEMFMVSDQNDGTCWMVMKVNDPLSMVEVMKCCPGARDEHYVYVKIAEMKRKLDVIDRFRRGMTLSEVEKEACV